MSHFPDFGQKADDGPLQPFELMTDEAAAGRLRDRIAREIAAAFDEGTGSDNSAMMDMRAVYRWLNAIANTQREERPTDG